MQWVLLAALALAGYAGWRWVRRQATQRWRAMIADQVAEFDRFYDANGLPTIAVSWRMNPGERCLWSGRCDWLEPRVKTARISARGLSVSIPLAKGVRYRAVSLQPTAERTAEWTVIDSGTLFLTNQRLVL